MQLHRRFWMILLVAGFAVAASLPAWAAPEKPAGLQGWLIANRGLLWTLFWIQALLLLLLAVWEVVFQINFKKTGFSRGTFTSDESGDTALDDPFKTAVSGRRPGAPPPGPPPLTAFQPAEEGSSPLARPSAPPPLSEGPPSLAQIARQSESEEADSLGGRRLGRIESAGKASPASLPSPAATPRVRPAPPPPAAAAGDEGGESWADVLKRTTQEGGERAVRRPVQIPSPASRGNVRPETPKKSEAELESSTEPAPQPLGDVVASRVPVRTVRAGLGGVTTPPTARPPKEPLPDGASRMPEGASRYAWDHALSLLKGALVSSCRLTPGGAAGAAAGGGAPSATLNLVTPPPAAAEKRRGRGMKLAAGGETRMGETYGRTTPLRPSEDEPVSGFTGVMQASAATPPVLQPVKRVDPSGPAAPLPALSKRVTPGALSPPTTRMGSTPPPAPLSPPTSRTVPPRPGGASEPSSEGEGGERAADPVPLAPPSSATRRAGPTPVGEGATLRRSLDLPVRRIEMAPRAADAKGGDFNSTEPSGGDAACLDEANHSIQKEIPEALRKPEGIPKKLEISKSLREKQENDEPDSK